MIIISILPLMSDGSKKFYFLLQNHMALYKWSVKVSWSSGAGFDPQNAGTTWQVLTKTATGYNWDDATWSIESSNDTYDNIIYLTQSEYDNLSSYEPNTLYSTPDWEAGTFVDDTAYSASWNWVTNVAPSKNAVYDIMETKASIVYITQNDYDLLPSSKLTDWVNYVIIEEDS